MTNALLTGFLGLAVAVLTLHSAAQLAGTVVEKSRHDAACSLKIGRM